MVRAFVWSARSKPLASLAITLSWLGNGWAYLVIAFVSLIVAGTQAMPALALSALNAGLLHCLYPSLKRWVARPRPYQSDSTLMPLLDVLDEYSFPSGHAMTLSAALVPLVLMFPQILGLAIGTWLLMAWARLASAHHYPSDVAAGAALGVTVSYPTSLCIFAASRLVS